MTESEKALSDFILTLSSTVSRGESTIADVFNAEYSSAIAKPKPLQFTALQKYTKGMAGDSYGAVENLRYFCSKAMNDQDWLDAEVFFDAVISENAQSAQPVGMMQDESGGLSKWLSNTPNARQEARNAISQPVQPPCWNLIDDDTPRDNKRMLYLARFFTDGRIDEVDFDGMWEHETGTWEMPENYWYWGSANEIEYPTHWAYQDQPVPTVAFRAIGSTQSFKDRK